MTDPFALLQRTLAERYTVGRELGRGGMATVYLASDLKHHRDVAIKVLKPELAAALGSERFLREIDVAAGLNHPHILPLFDSGAVGQPDSEGALLWYAMPYVEGESLRDRLDRESQLPLDDALKIAQEVADALGYAHSRGIVHRDIKPENILLAGYPSRDRGATGGWHALVADFGIARALGVAGGERLTETGLSIGTPSYMSPEQALGETIDGRSDIYALGCVLYEMLVGEPPYTGPSAQAIIARRLSEPVPSLRVVREVVPAAVEAAVHQALARLPADRFATAALFSAALAKRDAGSAPVASSRRVRRLALIGVAAVVVVSGMFLHLRLARDRLAPADPVHERTAIAVLPFTNLSAEGPHSYFAGGLQDEILTQLSKVAALTVISRTSVMGYAGQGTPLRQIARELGVGSVVEGSVQVVGERLRVNVQLIDAATDAHLWAERYDRTLDDAFAIQSDVAQRIVEAVGAVLSNAERQGLAAPPTANAEAYRLYLQGGEYGGDREGWETAQHLYERALALDPGFALAHVALSEAHGFMYLFRYDPSPARAARQREEAETALRLAPDLPQAHAAMAQVFYATGPAGYREALNEFRTALEGLPNDASLWTWIGLTQRRLGNWNEVLTAFDKVTQLDPRAAGWFYNLGGQTYDMLFRYAEAVGVDDRTLSLDPDLHNAAILKGWTYVRWQGQLDTLRAVLSHVPRDEDLGKFGTKTAQDVQLLFLERKPDSLLRVLATARIDVFKSPVFFLPASLYSAWAHQLRGDHAAAHAAFDSARVLLDSVMRDLSDDWRVHAARGLSLAGLGRRDEALREARWLQQSEVYWEDAFDGPLAAEDRARILAQAGDVDAARDEIERLLTRPSWLSVHTLRLDPRWDPIREDPQFKALLVRHARAGSS